MFVAWNIPYTQYEYEKEKINLPECIEQPNNNHQNISKNYTMLIPAQLICLIKEDNGDLSAIVHSCLQYQKKISVLTYRWQLEYRNVRLFKLANAQYNDN